MPAYCGPYAELLHARDSKVIEALADHESLSIEGIRGFGYHADLEGTLRRLVGQGRVVEVERLDLWWGDIRIEFALSDEFDSAE